MNETFELVVDYDKTLQQMISDGDYFSASPDITEEDFPKPKELSGKVNIIAKIFHFNQEMTDKSVKDEMKKEGFCPAHPFELFALGEVQPELQRQFPIVALGLVFCDVDGGRSAVYLSSSGGGKRKAYLYYSTFPWDNLCRFLGKKIE